MWRDSCFPPPGKCTYTGRRLRSSTFKTIKLSTTSCLTHPLIRHAVDSLSEPLAPGASTLAALPEVQILCMLHECVQSWTGLRRPPVMLTRMRSSGSFDRVMAALSSWYIHPILFCAIRHLCSSSFLLGVSSRDVSLRFRGHSVTSYDWSTKTRLN